MNIPYDFWIIIAFGFALFCGLAGMGAAWGLAGAIPHYLLRNNKVLKEK
jgi:hypothetical protein